MRTLQEHHFGHTVRVVMGALIFGGSIVTSHFTSAASAQSAQAEGASIAELPEPYASAEYNRGRRVFRRCQACHTVNDGGASRSGPNLYGVFGRQAGGIEGFRYSKALREADFEWTPARLDEWLQNPRSFLTGNRMAFSGLRNETDRVAVIAYIMAETGYVSASD